MSRIGGGYALKGEQRTDSPSVERAAMAHEHKEDKGVATFFRFPEDARWNEERLCVEFGVGIGEYEGVVRIPRQVFRRFVDGAVTPERCVEAYYLRRTRLERIPERKLRNRQITDVGNVEITGRDLRSIVSDLEQAANGRYRLGAGQGAGKGARATEGVGEYSSAHPGGIRYADRFFSFSWQEPG